MLNEIPLICWCFLSKNPIKNNFFISLGGIRFAINLSQKHNMHLYNQNLATIPSNRFSQIVQTYWREASFCINLEAEPINKDSNDITPAVSRLFHSLGTQIENFRFCFLNNVLNPNFSAIRNYKREKLL